MVDMTKPFITRIRDDKQRRIVIDKKTWIDEELKQGDYVEVRIRKVKLSG